MKAAIDETNRRRAVQEAHNKKHGITPKTVEREVTKSITKLQQAIADASKSKKKAKKELSKKTEKQIKQRIIELETEMRNAAEKLDFEKAIALREQVHALKDVEKVL